MSIKGNRKITKVEVYCQGGMLIGEYYSHGPIHHVEGGGCKFEDVNGNHITVNSEAIVVMTEEPNN